VLGSSVAAEFEATPLASKDEWPAHRHALLVLLFFDYGLHHKEIRAHPQAI